MYSLANFSYEPALVINPAAAPMIAELMQAWFRATHQNVGPADGKFKFTARVIDVPSKEPPGDLGEEAVSSLTNTFHIARGLALSDFSSRLACAEALYTAIQERTPGMDWERLHDHYSLYPDLCGGDPEGPSQVPVALLGPAGNCVVVLTSASDECYPNHLIMRSEHLTILRLLAWFEELAQDMDVAYSLLSINICRARVVRFERCGYEVKLQITRWFDLRDRTYVTTLHRILCADWPPTGGHVAAGRKRIGAFMAEIP